MVLVRRAYFVESENDDLANDIAGAVMADKSEVVDLALAKGLAQMDGEEVGAIAREIAERRLRRLDKGSIKSASVERRSK